ncbi:MAG: phosphatase PAP2 family protein [Pirellulaceae bacterium]
MACDARPKSFWLAAVFAVLACAALTIDVPVARCQLESLPLGDFRKMLDICEAFAHGFGVLMILTTAAVLDPLNRPRLSRVAACAFGAGLVATLVKHIFPRMRPNVFDASGDVLSTFLPWGAEAHAQAAELGRRAIQSFPSGHTATAVGLAFGLAWLYPRGRWLFAVFAVLAAAQRIGSSAHFVSDTLAAAAMASVVAGLCLSQRGVGRWFTRLEQKPRHATVEHAEIHYARMTVQVPPRDKRVA